MSKDASESISKTGQSIWAEVIKANSLDKRRGRFVISNSILLKCPEEVMTILSKVLIVKADNDFSSGNITYHGYSKYFEPLDDSEQEPEYEWTLTHGKNGVLQIEQCKRLHFTDPICIEKMLEKFSKELNNTNKLVQQQGGE